MNYSFDVYLLKELSFCYWKSKNKTQKIDKREINGINWYWHESQKYVDQ